MRILCLSYEYPPIGGGGSPICQGVAESLVSVGHQVDVVTSAMPDLPLEEEVNGVHVHRVKCVRRHRHMATTFELGTTLLPSYRRAMDLCQQHTYDLIHCHFILPSGIVAHWVAAKTGLPYILTAHGSDVPGYNPDRFHLAHRLIRPLWRRVIHKATAITSPSQFLATLINKKIDVPIEIIPNGMTIPPRVDVPRVNRVLMASRLFERKGVQDVLRALKDFETDWEICVAGDGPYLPTLKKLATDLGVNVNFLGFVPRDELAKLYHSSKIFVFPSHRENFPVVLLEAMSAGCAVITAVGSGSDEVVGDAAVCVKNGDINAMRIALQRLMNDEQEIAALRERAYEHVQRFSWQHVANDYDNLFRRCAGEAPEAVGATPSADLRRAEL